MISQPLKWSIIEPPPAVEAAPTFLELAVEALFMPDESMLTAKERKAAASRRRALAHVYARAVDWTAFEWFWLEGGLEWERRSRTLDLTPYDGVRATPSIPAQVKREVLARDGFRCRYCRLRVISPAAMTALERTVPAALPVGRTSFETHRLWLVLRLSWDHVVARSRGGTNDRENIVVSCGACNYNKGTFSLSELGLHDPRSPLKDGWTGLNGALLSKPLMMSIDG